MKIKIMATSLFVLTAAAVVLYPQHNGNATTQTGSVNHAQVITAAAAVEVVFVLDTTSSMTGMIEAAKEKIWSIASSMASAQPAPEIRMGLVAFRDRGDAYVTRVVDLSADLDSMYATLMDFRAAGGGDTPESVNQALNDAIHKISWSQNPSAYKVVFLLGDSPPHMDYQDEPRYPEILAVAADRGIVVNAIQCGPNPGTAPPWRQIARLGKGRYFQVEQSGSAVAIATPFDSKLAEVSRQLDDTRLYYGTKADKEKQQRKLEATAKLHASSSIASRARRATFNASKSGKANLLGRGELVEEVMNGQVDISAIEHDELPTTMQSMSPMEREALIVEKTDRRKDLQRQIRHLTEQRAAFIEQKVKDRGGAEASLDDKIYSAVRDQAAKLGLRYESESSAY